MDQPLRSRHPRRNDYQPSEKAIILGTGVYRYDKGRNGVFHQVNGYPDLIPVVVTQITLQRMAIVAALSVGPNALYHNVTEVCWL